VSAIQYDTVAGAQARFLSAPKVTILGSLVVEVSVGLGRQVWIFNEDTKLGLVHYVAIGDTGLAAPTSCADSIAIPPGEYIVINTADIGSYIRSDVGVVYGYLVARDNVLLDVLETNA
jgi:hypothetical protein